MRLLFAALLASSALQSDTPVRTISLPSVYGREVTLQVVRVPEIGGYCVVLYSKNSWVVALSCPHVPADLAR